MLDESLFLIERVHKNFFIVMYVFLCGSWKVFQLFPENCINKKQQKIEKNIIFVCPAMCVRQCPDVRHYLSSSPNKTSGCPTLFVLISKQSMIFF